MKKLMKLSMAVSISILLLVTLFSSVVYAQTSAEPDDYAEGTDISNVFTGVTLSAVGPGWDGTTGPEVYAINSASQPTEPFVASTGSLVFGHSGLFPHLWREPGLLQLRADFAATALFVSLDFIGNNGSDFGQLLAYDSGGTLIDSAYTGQLTADAVETLTVSGGGIAYVLAGGIDGESSLGLDNMVYSLERVKVTGGGTVDWPGGRVTYGFTAQSDASGAVKGEAQFQHRDIGLRNHADVLYLAVSGGDAWIGAVITQSDDPALVGQEIYFRVRDNGEGKKATGPDMVSSVVPGPAVTALAMPPLDMIEWTSGNVQVK